jgi:hypothetical protein
MVKNYFFLILIIFIFVLIFLEYLNKFVIEGYMTIIGPVIIPKESMKDEPKNIYYQNNKIYQDFDPDSVVTFYS